MQEWIDIDQGRHARLLQLRHRRLPGGGDSAGLRGPAPGRRPADGMGRAEHEVAQPARKRSGLSKGTTATAGTREQEEERWRRWKQK